MEENERTDEARVLDYYPELRQAVVESPEFASWLRSLTKLDVDGETFYLRGGDMLRDIDQVMFEWARKNGTLTDTAIQQALTAEHEATTSEDKDGPEATGSARDREER